MTKIETKQPFFICVGGETDDKVYLTIQKSAQLNSACDNSVQMLAWTHFNIRQKVEQN